jgi:hypothetical protein
MLAVGDLLWVPFVYSLQARYLAFRPKDLGYAWSALILAVNFLGYYIFRASNNEKNEFRNGRNSKSTCMPKQPLQEVQPNDVTTADLEYMTTEQGSKLLTSGWWGRSRHPNYLCVVCHPLGIPMFIVSRGDLLMALAWSLPTGFDTPVTYFYVIYFAVLLVHRQRRDDEKCEKKYARSSLYSTPISLNVQVRKGLGQVPEARSLPHYPLCLLSSVHSLMSTLLYLLRQKSLNTVDYYAN